MSLEHSIEDAFMVPGMGYVPPVKVPVYTPSIDAFLLEHESSVDYRDSIATTTFGPLSRYVPANDNKPGPSAYLRGPHDAAYPRSGDFMQVYPSGKFWPLDPREDEITIEAIANGLASETRYGGQAPVENWYSVAEHSVLLARWLLKETGDFEIALCGLLHDASEAFIKDVTRNLKPHLSNYREIESRIMTAVCRKFKLPLDFSWIVKHADDRIIADEVRAIMVPMDWHKKHDRPLGVTIRCWGPVDAKEEFLATFAALRGNLGSGL